MASETASYALMRGRAESQRLNEQHKFFTETIQYSLHPSIMQALPESPRIADIATGTGIFLVELAGSLPPTAQLDGFDISPLQFPPAASLPDNVALHVADARAPPAPELHGRFDAVHLRLLAGGMLEPDWALVARNAVQLLRPGGAIQWTESNHMQNSPALRQELGSTTARLTRFVQDAIDMFTARGRLSRGMLSMKETFEALGLVGVEEDVVSSDRLPSNRKFATETNIAALEGIYKVAGFSDEEVKAKMAAATRDAESGAYVRWNLHVVRGFKPQ